MAKEIDRHQDIEIKKHPAFLQSATISSMKYLFEFGVEYATRRRNIPLYNPSSLLGHQKILKLSLEGAKTKVRDGITYKDKSSEKLPIDQLPTKSTNPSD